MGSFRFMFSFATNLAIQSITVGAVELLGNGAAAWRIIALIYCVIGIITNTLAVFSVKELPEEELKSNGSMGIEDDKLSFKQTVKLLFANKYFSMICVIYILQQLRAAMVNVGIFFMTYVLLNKNLFGVFSWANNIPLIIALAITPMLVAKANGMYKLNIVKSSGERGPLIDTYERYQNIQYEIYEHSQRSISGISVKPKRLIAMPRHIDHFYYAQ